MGNPKIRCWQPATELWRGLVGRAKKPLLLHRSLRLERAEFKIPGPLGAACRAVYIGESLSFPYFEGLYGAREADGRPVSLPDLKAELSDARSQFPVVIVEINRWLARLLPPGALQVEPWIVQRTLLTGERYRRRQRGIEKGFGRAIRKHGFTYRLTQTEGDVEQFYRTQYMPHAAARWGEQAYVLSMRHVASAARRGFLLQVWWKDRWVSGAVLRRMGRDTLLLVALGMDPSCLGTWQKGMLEASYYFAIQWARENGLRAIDFGGSRPHLLDGVFHHKTLWGAEPFRDPWHHTTLAFYLDTASSLPKVVTQQLVWLGDRLVTVAEALTGPESAERLEAARRRVAAGDAR